MAKSIPALITPEVLQWARELDRISVAEIAPKLKVTEEKILAWESGKEYPTLLQAKDLAKRYRVPFVYFYLPSIPLRAKRIDKVDYRTFPHTGGELLMSRELRWLLRDIEERRDTMIELYTLEDLKPVKQELYIEQETTEQEFAEAIRNLLALTSDRQIGFRRPENALTYCINQLEKKDYLVFQASGIDPQEMRGLSVAYDVFPIIVLNRKDEQSARLFTLCHELVHILSRTSGICNKTGEDETAAKSLELFCNRVAGLVLVPTEELISNPHTSNIKNFGLNDTEVYALIMSAFTEFSDPFDSAGKALQPVLGKTQSAIMKLRRECVDYQTALEKFVVTPEYAEAKSAMEKQLFWEIGQYEVTIKTQYERKTKEYSYKFEVNQVEHERILSNINESIISDLKSAYGVPYSIQTVYVEIKE